MRMFQNDPDLWEAQTARHRDRMREGYSTSALGLFDEIWGITGFILKVLTSPIWFPISRWNKRKRRSQEENSPPTDSPKKPYY